MGILDELEEIAGPTRRLTKRTRTKSKDRHRVVNGIKEKRCTKCKKWKTLDKYYGWCGMNIGRSQKVHSQTYCKECQKSIQKRTAGL